MEHGTRWRALYHGHGGEHVSKKLQEMLRDDSNIMVKKSRYGIGLRNTNRRIKLLYGSDYGLTIESEVEERTCVTITFPKHRP